MDVQHWAISIINGQGERFRFSKAVQYGERERPEHLSIGLLIDAQVAHAPRTVPEVAPLSRTCICKSL